MIAEPTMVNLVGPAVCTKMDVIRRQGNAAVHRPGPVRAGDAVRTVAELFHVLYWVARHYTRNQDTAPAPALEFDKSLPDTHDYDEAESRELIIDLLLKEAGWQLDKNEDREYPVSGLPSNSGTGRVDYVLWDDNGKPLGLVEAKRTTKDATTGKQQAKLYAHALEREFGQRPVIFYTNGYQTFIWDDVAYPPREIQGFYTKDQLGTLIQRRTSRQGLSGVGINDEIAGRHYQSRAIRRIAESFERDRQRKALLVMATGAGKTRTIIALVDLLQRAHRIRGRDNRLRSFPSGEDLLGRAATPPKATTLRSVMGSGAMSAVMDEAVLYREVGRKEAMILWRKAARSKEDGSNCVELATAPGLVVVRDSKNPDGPKLVIGNSDFQHLAATLKSL